MKKSVWIATMTIGILLMMFTFQPTDAMSKTFVLKYSDPSPAGTARTKSYAAWGDWITQRTNGRVKIEYYWSGSLAKSTDNLKAVEGGICDLAYFASLVYAGGRLAACEFAELPFIFPAEPDWDTHPKVAMEMFRTVPALKKEIGRVKARFISANSGHPTNWICKKPIHKLEDFKGLRMRVLGPLADFVKAAGGSPEPIPVYETYEALQKGTVDGTQAYMYYNIPSKQHEVTKYCILPGVQFITTTVWLNKSVYNSFPDDIKKIFDEEAGNKLREIITVNMDAAWDKSIADLKAYGMEFITIAPDEFERWKALGKKAAISKWLEKMKKKGIDGEAILNKYSELYKKYERKK